jgi:hypothetical protein
MDQQMTPRSLEAKVFGPPGEGGDFLPLDLLRKMKGDGVAEIPAANDCFGEDLAHHLGGKSAADGFNFGELGHFV